MSNQSNKRDTGGQGVHGSQGGQQNEEPIPSGHEADTGDGEEEEEAENNSPNTGDRRPGGN